MQTCQESLVGTFPRDPDSAEASVPALLGG
jgi:hypothetical protein